MRVSLLRGLIAALCALCLSAPVLAKHVSVDFGPVFGSGGDGLHARPAQADQSRAR
jgi:hypothetical protein